MFNDIILSEKRIDGEDECKSNSENELIVPNEKLLESLGVDDKEVDTTETLNMSHSENKDPY